MNGHYENAEVLIKHAIDELTRLISKDDGENISYYHSKALDSGVMSLIHAKREMDFGECATIYKERIAELEAQLEEVRRHNELLQAVADVFGSILADEQMSFMVSGKRLKAVELLNTAIDGGALSEATE